MTSNKISKKGGRSGASASSAIVKENANPNSLPDAHVMDLVYNFLNDFGYHKATHRIRLETQKREAAGDHTTAATWMGKSKELPTLQRIFEEWQGGKHLLKSSKRAATVAQVDGGAETVPLPESDEDSDERSEQSTSSGEESDDESSSASEEDSDSSSDEDEEMEEAEEVMVSAKKASASKLASAAALPTVKGKVEASPSKSQKRKRSPSTSSSEASSDSSDDDSDDSNSSDESDDAPATKKAKLAPDSDATSSEATSSEDESDESSVEAAGVPLPESSDESSSDSEEVSSSEESGSEDDTVPAKSSKTAKSQLASQTTAAAEAESSASEDSSSASESDDDSSSSDSDSESLSPITQPTTNDASSADDNKGSESSETLAHPSPDFQPLSAPADDHVHPSRKHQVDDEPEDASGAQKPRKKSNVPFSRIKDDTVVDQRFASNAFVPYDYAQKAHEKLIITKGKGFTKEKNKGKRGSYRGGLIDISGTKGIKFED